MTRPVNMRLAIAGSLALCLAGWADTVYTRDGRVLRGEISLSENGDVKVMTPKVTETVPAAKLVRAVFDAPVVQPGLAGVTFRIFQGDWNRLPDFRKLAIDKSGRMTSSQLDLSPLDQEDARRVFNFSQGQSLLRWSAPVVEGRPFMLEATVDASAGDGVILAHGGRLEGYALYLKAGHLIFATRIKSVLTVARDEESFPLNKKVKVTAELRRDLGMVLTVDGREAAKAQSPSFVPGRPFEGLSVGFDQRPTPVGEYRLQNYFQGTLENVRVRLMGMAVVYAGQLRVAKAGTYQFKLAADSATRLAVNGRVLIDNANPASPPQLMGTAELGAGTHDFRLAYAQLQPVQPTADSAAKRAKLSLEWSGPGFSGQLLTGVAHPQASTWRPDDLAIPSAGVMTLDGSFIAQPVERIDAAKIHFAKGSLARKDLCAIFLRPLSMLDAKKLFEKPGGALLMDGSFTEGKLLSLNDQTVTVSSILFGLKKYSYGGEAVAVVFKPASGPVPRRLFKLRAGSHLYAEKFILMGKQIIFPDPPFNGFAIPFSQVAEMINGPQSNLLQAAEVRWEKHSPAGQHFLGARNRKALEVIKQFGEWKFRLSSARREIIAARKTLPRLIKAEAEAMAAHEKAKAGRDAPRKEAEAKAKVHLLANQAWTLADRKLDADCTRSAQASVALHTAVYTRQVPAIRSLAAAQWVMLRESFAGRKDALPAARAQRAAALKALGAANAEVAACELALTQAIQSCAASEQAELKTQHAEASAWRIAQAAQKTMARAELEFTVTQQDYNTARNELASMRARQARAKREIDLAKGTLEGLKPELQNLIQP